MNSAEITGTVFNIQRFSTDDGDGIRTCVFLKGCPLRCQWCHNAESLSFGSEVALYEQACIGCGACISGCPSCALSVKQGKIVLNRSLCRNCGICIDQCFSDALVSIGKRMTVDEVIKSVRKDKCFYKQNGGMTLSGGEPLAQAEFSLALAKQAKAEGISVVLETSGHGKAEDLCSFLPYCDLFLFDCKASGEKHKELTGVDDGLILKNLELLCSHNAKVILRCPIVPNANLDRNFIEKIITLSKKHSSIQSVQLMPYHKTGVGKAESLGKVPQQIFEVPSQSLLSEIAAYVEQKSDKRVTY